MQPVGADRLTRPLVIVTFALWAIQALFGWIPYASIRGGFIPGRVTFNPPLWPSVPVPLTPLSATLIHADIFHAGLNLMTLLYIGRIVEGVIGPRLLALLYVVGAYVSAGGQFITNPQSMQPMIGASGAISAVMGAYAMMFSRSEVKRIGPIPAWVIRGAWLAVAWVGIQWMFGIAMGRSGVNVAIAAHIGGFLAGLVMARPLLAWRYRGA
jgi:membrane associated rhomboid family serine protease